MQLDASSLPAHLATTLVSEIVPLRSLEQVVRWAFSRTPPSDVTEVVVQDEYTHDVVIPWNGVHLVFDTT